MVLLTKQALYRDRSWDQRISMYAGVNQHITCQAIWNSHVFLPARTSMRVVLPAPLTPMRQVSTPGRKAPLMPSSSSSMACPPSWCTCSLPSAASCMPVAGCDCTTSRTLLASLCKKIKERNGVFNTPAMVEACYSSMATRCNGAGHCLVVCSLPTAACRA